MTALEREEGLEGRAGGSEEDAAAEGADVEVCGFGIMEAADPEGRATQR